MVVVFKKI